MRSDATLYPVSKGSSPGISVRMHIAIELLANRVTMKGPEAIAGAFATADAIIAASGESQAAIERDVKRCHDLEDCLLKFCRAFRQCCDIGILSDHDKTIELWQDALVCTHNHLPEMTREIAGFTLSEV